MEVSNTRKVLEIVEGYTKYTSEPTTEYLLQKAISVFLNTVYPTVEYRIDFAGSNLSKSQSIKQKTVNKRKGWHDMELYDHRGNFGGLCIELKRKSSKPLIRKKDALKRLEIEVLVKGKKCKVKEPFLRTQGMWYDPHIERQAKNAALMRKKRRAAGFGKGLKNCLFIVVGYLEEDFEIMEEGFMDLPYEWIK